MEHLCLHNWGEPILNENLFKMIQYAQDRGIHHTVFNTNGTLLDNKTIGQIIESPLSILRISIDGNPDTYRKIRGTDFKPVEDNILNLIKRRDDAKSPLQIGIVMVVDEQTESEMESFHSKWKNIVDHIRFQPKLTRSTRTDFCPELFGKNYGEMVVLWDGKVIPCCVDYEGELTVGNVLYETVDSIWDGITMKQLRKKHLEKDFPTVCKDCNEYESKKAEKRFVAMANNT